MDVDVESRPDFVFQYAEEHPDILVVERRNAKSKKRARKARAPRKPVVNRKKKEVQNVSEADSVQNVQEPEEEDEPENEDEGIVSSDSSAGPSLSKNKPRVVRNKRAAVAESADSSVDPSSSKRKPRAVMKRKRRAPATEPDTETVETGIETEIMEGETPAPRSRPARRSTQKTVNYTAMLDYDGVEE
jgi:hypothetical protein